MSWALIRLDEVAPVPWRNGGGVTRELLAWPSPGDWALRVSVAEVERDGPFSQYPGVQRWFAVLSGGGVRLTVAGQVCELRAGGTFVAAYSHQGNTAVRRGLELLEIPPNALAWRILDSDGQLELLGENALWMEITP